MHINVLYRKKSPTALRKLNWLPRIGLYIDFAGYEFIYKHVPLLESMINLLEGPLTENQLRSIIRRQLAEIKFPNWTKPTIVDTSYRAMDP